MKTTQNQTISLIATDRVSIWEWKDRVNVTFAESAEVSTVVEHVSTEEFLRACVYFIHGLSHTKELSRTNQTLLNSILEDLKVMENNKAPEVVA